MDNNNETETANRCKSIQYLHVDKNIYGRIHVLSKYKKHQTNLVEILNSEHLSTFKKNFVANSWKPGFSPALTCHLARKRLMKVNSLSGPTPKSATLAASVVSFLPSQTSHDDRHTYRQLMRRQPASWRSWKARWKAFLRSRTVASCGRTSGTASRRSRSTVTRKARPLCRSRAEETEWRETWAPRNARSERRGSWAMSWLSREDRRAIRSSVSGREAWQQEVSFFFRNFVLDRISNLRTRELY